MRPIVFGLSFILLSAAGAHADVLGDARAGKLQCFEPNVANKTCRGLFKIIMKPDGSASSGGDLVLNVLNGNSVLIMRTPQSAVTVTANSTCSTVRKSDIEGSVFLLDGKPVNTESDRRIKDDMETRQAERFGKTDCSVYAPAGANGFLVTDTVDGKPQPGGAHMMWVSSADGYKVAP